MNDNEFFDILDYFDDEEILFLNICRLYNIDIEVIEK